jgi:alanine-glyoxylate transaminase / serine-glyoxylate transaminase / serine-pyruvate transaminase
MPWLFFSLSLQTYGAKVHQIKAEIGATVSQSEIEAALQSTNYKILTITHVDTSTGHFVPFFRRPHLNLALGVLSDVKAAAQIAKRVSPHTLVRSNVEISRLF